MKNIMLMMWNYFWVRANEENERNLEHRKKIHKAEKFMKQLHDPLLYVGSVCDWLSAGERVNVLICFVAGCSQIILKNPQFGSLYEIKGNKEVIIGKNI